MIKEGVANPPGSILSPKHARRVKSKGHSKNNGSMAIASKALFDDLDCEGDRVGGGRGSVIIPQDFKFSSTGTPLSIQRGPPHSLFNTKRLSGTSKKSALLAQSLLKPLVMNGKQASTILNRTLDRASSLSQERHPQSRSTSSKRREEQCNFKFNSN